MPAMSERHCCSITLIVIGDDLEPEKVTSALGWSPNQSWRRGEQKQFIRRDGSIRTFGSIHEWGGWKLFSSDEERKLSLDEQLTAWMARLRTKGHELQGLHQRGWKSELNFFVASSECLDMPVNVLNALASLGVGLNLTLSTTGKATDAP